MLRDSLWWGERPREESGRVEPVPPAAGRPLPPKQAPVNLLESRLAAQQAVIDDVLSEDMMHRLRGIDPASAAVLKAEVRDQVTARFRNLGLCMTTSISYASQLLTIVDGALSLPPEVFSSLRKRRLSLLGFARAIRRERDAGTSGREVRLTID